MSARSGSQGGLFSLGKIRVYPGPDEGVAAEVVKEGCGGTNFISVAGNAVQNASNKDHATPRAVQAPAEGATSSAAPDSLSASQVKTRDAQETPLTDGDDGHSGEILGHIRSFLHHGETIAAYWSSMSQGLLEQQLPSFSDPLVQQKGLDGEVVGSIDDLYDAAAVARAKLAPALVECCPEEGIQVSVQGADAVSKSHGDGPELPTIKILIAPLKDKKRALEKAEDDYKERLPGPPFSYLYDIVRGSVMCPDEASMLSFIEKIRAHPKLRVLRLKNRFQHPTPAGFRDVNLNIIIEGQHVAEVQVHHQAIKAFEAQHHSHAHYEFFRTFFQGSVAAVEERLQALRNLGPHASAPNLVQLVHRVLSERRPQTMHDLKTLLSFLQEHDLLLLVQRAILEDEVASCEGASLGSKPGSVGVARARVEIGGTLQGKGKLDEARTEFEAALAIYRARSQGEEQASSAFLSVEMARSLRMLAGIHSTQGRRDEARPLYEEALAMYRADGGDPPALAGVLMSLAGLDQIDGKVEQARATYDEAVRVYRGVSGNEHPGIANVHHNLAVLAANEKRFDDAVGLYQEEVRVRRKAYGRDHPSVASAVSDMATVMQQQGRLDEAAREYEDVLRIKRKLFGPTHPSIIPTLFFMAILLHGQGKAEEAQRLMMEAMSIKAANH